MESNGVPDRVHISEDAYTLLSSRQEKRARLTPSVSAATLCFVLSGLRSRASSSSTGVDCVPDDCYHFALAVVSFIVSVAGLAGIC